MNMYVFVSSLEPVNRATAAREFRVFHAALHSLNSAYRDSVSRRDAGIPGSMFGVDPKLKIVLRRPNSSCYFYQYLWHNWKEEV